MGWSPLHPSRQAGERSSHGLNYLSDSVWNRQLGPVGVFCADEETELRRQHRFAVDRRVCKIVRYLCASPTRPGLSLATLAALLALQPTRIWSGQWWEDLP